MTADNTLATAMIDRLTHHGEAMLSDGSSTFIAANFSSQTTSAG